MCNSNFKIIENIFGPEYDTSLGYFGHIDNKGFWSCFSMNEIISQVYSDDFLTDVEKDEGFYFLKSCTETYKMNEEDELIFTFSVDMSRFLYYVKTVLES